MKISILIPGIPERLERLKELIQKYQAYALMYSLDIEIISLVDNKRMSIGEKRNNLVDLAKGEYWVMTDDDADELTQVYFERIGSAIEKNVDVITYKQHARINEDQTTVVFGLHYENQEFQKDGITKRPAWHCCTWKRDFISWCGAYFKDINYGEDEPFARHANERAKTSFHIDEVCHVYVHDSTKTASFDERSN